MKLVSKMVYWKVGDKYCVYRQHAEKERSKTGLPIEQVKREKLK